MQVFHAKEIDGDTWFQMEVRMKVENVNVYGLEDSIKASKYPMSVNTSKCNSDITPRVKALGKCEKGAGHDQFLTGIIVQFDLTFSIKAWCEAERYHFLDFVSSQSTMHRITKFKISEQVNEYVDDTILTRFNELVEEYNNNPAPEKYLVVLYNIPTGFELTARMTTNYRQLKTIYSQRHDHRLPEWRELCHWMESLPYFKEIVLED